MDVIYYTRRMREEADLMKHTEGEISRTHQALAEGSARWLVENEIGNISAATA